MLRIVIIILLIIISNTLYSQNSYSLKGSVFGNELVLTHGDVLLLSSHDKKIITYTSINNGIFYFDGIQQGTYRLRISCLGFKEYGQELILDEDIELSISLSENTTELDEVAITSTKRPIENKNGNIIVNVENTIFSLESNSLDLVSKLPKIQISNDRETISVMGKGAALIYLGNQKISIQEFKNLTIDEIKSIEIINNPSSKYDADGRSVILVHRKFSDKNGVKGTVLETASFRKNYNNFFGSNISVKMDKLELKFNAGYNSLHPWESNGSDYSITNKNIESSYIVETDDTKRPQFIGGGGFYYQINESDYLSMNSTLRSQKDEFLIKTNTSNKENDVEDHIFTRSDNDDFRFFSSTNVNYNKSLTQTGNLFIGGQYSYFNKELGSEIANSLNGSETILDQNRLQDFKVNVFSLKFDFENEFSNQLKLELGAAMSITNAETDAQISIINPSSYCSSNYHYREKNYAGYTQLSGKVGKFSYTSGVRGEITDRKGGFKSDTTLLVDGNNFKLFPKAVLNFEIDSTKNITLNYAKSIVRPNFTTVSSISTYLSPFLEFNQNIELESTIINELSLNYSLKTYSISASYTSKENPVFYNIAYNEASQISTMSPTNFENEKSFVLELTIPINYKFWNSTTVLNFAVNKVSDSKSISLNAEPYLYIYTSHQFKINNTLSTSLSGWGYTKHSEGVYRRNGVFAVNASINKKFLKNIDVSLSVNDIFKSVKYEDSYSVNNIKANTLFYTDMNEFSFSVKYAFGKLKKSTFKNKDVDLNLNRIN